MALPMSERILVELRPDHELPIVRRQVELLGGTLLEEDGQFFITKGTRYPGYVAYVAKALGVVQEIVISS